MKVSFHRHFCIIALALAVALPAFAKSSGEITQFGHDIRIGQDQRANDVTCISCSVYIRGQVAGDIVTIGGNIVLEDNGMIAGDVTTVLGDLRLDNGTQIAGEVSVIGGKLRRPAEAKIAGDVTVMEGRAWIYLALISPLLILAGIIALVVWLVRRRRPAPVYARAA
jgi:predicted acyltransferase (DUF342 family)